MVLDYDELLVTLQRLQKNLKSFGLNALVGRAQIAHNLLNRPSVANALDTRLQVMERRHPKVQNPICYNAQKLTKDVSYKIFPSMFFLLIYFSFSVLKL